MWICNGSTKIVYFEAIELAIKDFGNVYAWRYIAWRKASKGNKDHPVYKSY
jgi:hypothetical protein